jgi:hypothetical protein
MFVQETAAATKIQSVYRRNKAMWALEQQGVSTSAIRNRKRRRKAAERNGGHSKKVNLYSQSEDAPSFFNCCAVGLAFGDATEDDDDAYRKFQKEQYEERQKQQSMHEDSLRKRYMKRDGTINNPISETVEVVD